MSTKREEAADGCFAKAAADEPVFVLRAKDVFAPAMIRLWATAARAAGTPADKTNAALNTADQMEAWQKQHGSKVPD